MKLNSETKLPHRTEAVECLYFAAEDFGTQGIEYLPYFYAEARIDINDVRTGLRETSGVSKAMEIYSTSADLFWANDMIHDIDTQKIITSVPDGACFGSLPDFVDASFISRMETQFVQYLLRSFVTRIYRNSALNVYSLSGESRAEFISRCLELFDGPLRQELDLLHDVFKRRLEQLKEKFVPSSESSGLEQARIESQNRDIFSRYADYMAELFLQSRLGVQCFIEPPSRSPIMLELEERLAAMGVEAQNAISKINSSYKEKAQSLDDYLLHSNLKDIHLVRSCILWMPKKAN
jgi:hypothetical protein